MQMSSVKSCLEKMVITTKRKLSKFLPANDWINRTLSILMFKYYLAIKKEESTDTCYNINEPQKYTK